MGRFAKGLRRSHPQKIAAATPLEAHPTVAARLLAHREGRVALADSGSILSFAPAKRADQGQSGSCTWGSTSHAVYTSAAAQGKSIAFVPSQRLGYAATRAIERAAATPPGQPLPALTDSGAELADVMTVLARYGVKPNEGPTPDGRNYDIWTTEDTTAAAPNVNLEADLSGLETAAACRITGPYYVDPTSASASDTLAAAILSGMAIEMAFFCDTAFEDLQAGQVAGAPNQSDPEGGGHAVWLGSFEQQNGQRVFTLVNSWGDAWCSAGTCLVGPAWLQAAFEAWPIVISMEGP